MKSKAKKKKVIRLKARIAKEKETNDVPDIYWVVSLDNEEFLRYFPSRIKAYNCLWDAITDKWWNKEIDGAASKRLHDELTHRYSQAGGDLSVAFSCDMVGWARICVKGDSDYAIKRLDGNDGSI